MNLRILMVFIAFLFSQLTFSQHKFDEALKSILLKPEYRDAQVGVSLVDLNSNEQIYSYHGNQLFVPASTLKIITSAAAIEILGPEYRFKTKIGYTGFIEKNKLKGDLVVVGGGDPTLGSQYFKDKFFSPHFLETWAKRIKAAGISKISGDLVLDGSIYDQEEIPPTWIWEDIGNYYGAGASAFTVYDNLFKIAFNSPGEAGKPTQILSVYPKMNELEFENEVLSSDENRDLAYVFGSPFDKIRKIKGTIPKGQKAFTVKAAIQHPERILADELIMYLAKEGIFLSGKIKFEKVNPSVLQTVYIQESPSLAKIIKVQNHESVNLFAEHLVKQLAAEANGIGTRKGGIGILKDFWMSMSIDTEFFMEDGSGLSHFNAVSPQFFTSLLSYMFNQGKNKVCFINSLPSAGDGTLSGFNPQMFPENSLKAKSGSMTRVRCYAGYLDTGSGKKIAFSIMFNNFSGPSLQLAGEIQKLLYILRSS